MDGYGDCPADYAHNLVVELRNTIDTLNDKIHILEKKIHDLEIKNKRLHGIVDAVEEYSETCRKFLLENVDDYDEIVRMLEAGIREYPVYNRKMDTIPNGSGIMKALHLLKGY